MMASRSPIAARICGGMRMRALRAVEDPFFDQFVMAVILISCVFLALADPTVAEEPRYQVVVGL